ncbi:RING-type domain-containing protein [Pseudoscourfieldia marina]
MESQQQVTEHYYKHYYRLYIAQPGYTQTTAAHAAAHAARTAVAQQAQQEQQTQPHHQQQQQHQQHQQHQLQQHQQHQLQQQTLVGMKRSAEEEVLNVEEEEEEEEEVLNGNEEDVLYALGDGVPREPGEIAYLISVFRRKVLGKKKVRRILASLFDRGHVFKHGPHWRGLVRIGGWCPADVYRKVALLDAGGAGEDTEQQAAADVEVAAAAPPTSARDTGATEDCHAPLAVRAARPSCDLRRETFEAFVRAADRRARARPRAARPPRARARRHTPARADARQDVDDANGSAVQADECGLCFEALSLDGDGRRALFFPCLHAKQCLSCAMSVWESTSPTGDVTCPWCSVVLSAPPAAIYM